MARNYDNSRDSKLVVKKTKKGKKVVVTRLKKKEKK